MHIETDKRSGAAPECPLRVEADAAGEHEPPLRILFRKLRKSTLSGLDARRMRSQPLSPLKKRLGCARNALQSQSWQRDRRLALGRMKAIRALLPAGATESMSAMGGKRTFAAPVNWRSYCFGAPSRRSRTKLGKLATRSGFEVLTVRRPSNSFPLGTSLKVRVCGYLAMSPNGKDP